MSFFNRFFKKDNSKKVNKPKQSKFLPPKKAVIEERFISKFVNNGGKFLYCETYSEIKYNLPWFTIAKDYETNGFKSSSMNSIP